MANKPDTVIQSKCQVSQLASQLSFSSLATSLCICYLIIIYLDYVEQTEIHVFGNLGQMPSKAYMFRAIHSSFASLPHIPFNYTGRWRTALHLLIRPNAIKSENFPFNSFKLCLFQRASPLITLAVGEQLQIYSIGPMPSVYARFVRSTCSMKPFNATFRYGFH